MAMAANKNSEPNRTPEIRPGHHVDSLWLNPPLPLSHTNNATSTAPKPQRSDVCSMGEKSSTVAFKATCCNAQIEQSSVINSMARESIGSRWSIRCSGYITVMMTPWISLIETSIKPTSTNPKNHRSFRILVSLAPMNVPNNALGTIQSASVKSSAE